MQGVNAEYQHSLSSGLYRRLRNFTVSTALRLVDSTTGGESHPAPRIRI